jgi:acyl-CoA thioester hydrolase
MVRPLLTESTRAAKQLYGRQPVSGDSLTDCNEELANMSWMETCRGVVYPWHCDHLGHMNVQHYTAHFDIAAFHFLVELGFKADGKQDQGISLVDAQHTIQFKNEQRVGSLFKVESALLKVGNKSVTMMHRLRNIETKLIGATTEIVAVCFDLSTRSSIPIPDDIREKLQGFVMDPAEEL